MRPVIGICLTTVLGFLQLGVACAISAVVAHLDGVFAVTGSNIHTTCGLSMTGTGVCTYSYVSTAVGIILSLLLVGLVCASAEGSRGVGFCGPIISFLGFVYFATYAGIVTASAIAADSLSSEGHSLRVAAYALGWSATGLYALTFFLSAATAKSTLRGDGGRSTLARTLTRARYYQPAPSPNGSPKKAWLPMEQGSPKKWMQPHNPRNFVVTSNGVRTLLVVAGTPTTLSRTSTLAPGSGPSSVAGSMPPSPTKAPAGAAGMQHSLSMPGFPLPLPRSASGVSASSSTHYGHGTVPLPHALSLNAHPAALLQRGTSQQPPHGLARNSSSLHQALLQRVSAASGSSGSSQQHRLAHGSAQGGTGGSSSGSTPRDPTNRVLFETTRGKVSLGLLLASGGGMLAMNLMERFGGSAQAKQAVTLGLVFWLIFVLKMTWAAVKGELDGAAQAAAAVVAAPSSTAAPRGHGIAHAGTNTAKNAAKAAVVKESEEEDEGPMRRRRARRD